MIWLALLALSGAVWGQFDEKMPCFCKIGEAVEPCECTDRSLDHLNNRIIFDKLQRLLKKDFFRFYKVNMDKSCPFWPDERQCGSRQCGIAFCDDEVPEGIRTPAPMISVCSSGERQNDTAAAPVQDSNCPQEASNKFDPMDRTLEEGQMAQLSDMDRFESLEDKFCEVEAEDTESHYVDLSKNPERYTGYKGNSAIRVWKCIYQENCFKPDPKFDKNFLMNPNNFGLCLEKRVFYRIISGIHSAITISIAANNYREPPGGFGVGSWFRNTKMFSDRFGTKWSWEGPQRLRNIYFVYMLELRALLKAAPYLQKEIFYTGNEKEDSETRQLIEEILETIRAFPDHFDEKEMFTGMEAQALELREEFRTHFHNISRIMDCVDCDKCRLWGKVQVHGIGTALKILFADVPRQRNLSTNLPPFQLTRNEVVALFQSLGRYSSSIWETHEFRSELIPSTRKAFDEL